MLHNQVKFIVCFDYLIHLHNSWVPDFLQNFDLAWNPIYVQLVLNFIFFKNFDCNFFLCNGLDAKLYFAKSALSQGPINQKMGNLLQRAGSNCPGAHDQVFELVLLSNEVILIIILIEQ